MPARKGASNKAGFLIEQDANDLFRYRLVNERGEFVLRGTEAHSHRVGCEMVIHAVRCHAPLSIRYVLRGSHGRYSFILKDASGIALGESTIHNNTWTRKKQIKAVQCLAPVAGILVLAESAPLL